MKTCGKCKVEKPETEFYKKQASPDGLGWDCKLCNAVDKANWRKKNPGKTKRIRRRADLKHKYGLTVAGFEAILIAQNNQCAICARGLVGKRAADIDHCHATGKVRGVLCGACNMALGRFQDSEAVLLSAVEYLRKNK